MPKTCFPPEARTSLGERLIAIAASLQGSSKAGADKTAWAALRRAATLLPRAPERFLDFLDRRGAVDTRAVALRCIQRMLETSPPKSGEVHKSVSDRIADFAAKFLDPDVFAGGENALITQGAIYALAAIGDERLGEFVASAKKLGRRWLSRQLKAGLTEIIEVWKVAITDVTSLPAAVKIEQQIAGLN